VLSFLLPGCHTHEPAECRRFPAVATRFTANPLHARTTFLQLPQQTPNIKVGLAMQSGPDPVHVQFASRLGTVIVRELQLSPGSFEVQPLASLQLIIPSRPIETQTPSDVVTVSFQDPQNTLPPQLPPSPLFLAPVPPIVDQILVVRVIEYRPYFPMLATLEIRVLDGGTQDPLFTTTVTWSGVDDRLTGATQKSAWMRTFHHHDENCNPQALMHEIASDITAWYTSALNPPPPVQ
jgi:hypothetical protein